MSETAPIRHSINRTHVELWKVRELAILEEIDKTGKERKPQYKYSCLSRYCNHCTVCLCSMTICAPLVIWDLIGCTCINCCRVYCKHGLWIDGVYHASQKADKDVHDELRESIATSVNIRMYDSAVISIIHEYIRFYNDKKESSPKKAEIARKELVKWAGIMYHVYPALLKIGEKTPMSDIIEIMNEYRVAVPSYQTMA